MPTTKNILSTKPNLQQLLLKLLAAIIIAKLTIKFSTYLIKKSPGNKINALIINSAKNFVNNDTKSTYDFSHKNLPKKDGTYNVDCSGFVNLVLVSQNITNPIKEIIDFIPINFVPSILNNIPSPLHYSFFLQHKKQKIYWDSIDNVYSIIPGDFIIYNKISMEYQYSQSNSEYGQHIMIVADYPKKNLNHPQILWVPIYDSTKIPHGPKDKRSKLNINGIGESIIGLIINNDKKPISLIWQDHSTDNLWQPKKNHILCRDIKMARIINR